MSHHRFYSEPSSFQGSSVTLSIAETHHLTNVLRLGPGAEVFVFDGCGHEYRCTVSAVGGRRAKLEVLAALTKKVEPVVRFTLAQALAKGDKFDLIVQKATELGACAIVPLVTARSELKLNDDQAEKRLKRWQRISLEAVKQSGRRTLVEILRPAPLRRFLDTRFWRPDKLLGAGDAHDTPFVFTEAGGKPLRDALDAAVSRVAVTAIIGPEGGWSDEELDLFAKREYRTVTLGPRVLRTETAAIVALTLLQHALGDVSN